MSTTSSDSANTLTKDARALSEILVTTPAKWRPQMALVVESMLIGAEISEQARADSHHSSA